MKKLIFLFGVVIALNLLVYIPVFAEELSPVTGAGSTQVALIGNENDSEADPVFSVTDNKKVTELFSNYGSYTGSEYSMSKDDSESNFDLGFGVGSGRIYTVMGGIEGIDTFTTTSLAGYYKISAASTIYGNYTWGGNSYSTYTTMLTSFDVGNEIKFSSDISDDTLLIGYGNVNYTTIDPLVGTIDQKINGMYLGIKTTLFGIVRTIGKYYITPSGSIGPINLENLNAYNYDLYLQFNMADSSSMKVGYSASFVSFEFGGLEINTMMSNGYISWLYRL